VAALLDEKRRQEAEILRLLELLVDEMVAPPDFSQVLQSIVACVITLFQGGDSYRDCQP
jgi:hypothetical protein